MVKKYVYLSFISELTSNLLSVALGSIAKLSSNEVTLRSRFGVITSEYISMDYCTGNCFAKSPGLFKELPNQITACVPVLTSSLVVEYKNQVCSILLIITSLSFSMIDILSRTFSSRSVLAEEPLAAPQTNQLYYIFT